MQNFKGAIFDMDGTLLDSMPVWHRLTQNYLAQFGVHISDEDYARTEGFSQPEVAQYFIDRYPVLPMDAQGLMDGMDRLIEARYAAIARPKDGVLGFLNALRARGVKMAVATLTARRHAEKALRDRDMLDYFAFMLTIEDVGVSKHEPDIYLHTAERLGLAPEECVVFEDAPYACTTAKRAGFRVCGMAEPAYAAGEAEARAASDCFVEHSFDELYGKLL
ncbi:MAG: HAD family hydrolase [Agathobaculum sp.]|jgi:HAD superfamily hydrolase (TIGR01509 family)|uniref:HAD family hydrolase n=1 Tax=Agathobaculum sp. TaxID=2048138 RepID=UPI003D919B05